MVPALDLAEACNNNNKYRTPTKEHMPGHTDTHDEERRGTSAQKTKTVQTDSK